MRMIIIILKSKTKEYKIFEKKKPQKFHTHIQFTLVCFLHKVTKRT